MQLTCAFSDCTHPNLTCAAATWWQNMAVHIPLCHLADHPTPSSLWHLDDRETRPLRQCSFSTILVISWRLLLERRRVFSEDDMILFLNSYSVLALQRRHRAYLSAIDAWGTFGPAGWYGLSDRTAHIASVTYGKALSHFSSHSKLPFKKMYQKWVNVAFKIQRSSLGITSLS